MALGRGSGLLARILQRAFPPPASWYGPYGACEVGFSWGVHVRKLPEDQLRPFLRFLTKTLFVETFLDEAWAVAKHRRNGVDRTGIGELVYRAKYEGDAKAVRELAALVAERAAQHPGIRRADLVLAVPACPSRTSLMLPDVLAEAIARAIDRPRPRDVLVKTRPTNVKDLAGAEERVAALQGAYHVTRRLEGRRVVLVDDLLQSGSTLNHVAGLLRQAGASEVIGFAATKTLRD
jgi:predicted amidophosphoribosyltransferase